MFWKRALILLLGTALGVVLMSRPARAANITLQGTIGTDDAIQLFNFSVATPGLIDIRNYGYAGGTTSTGILASGGGFDSILTLFDGAGDFLTDNDDGAGAAIDPLTGITGDARITIDLAAGNYIVALTQFDNFAAGFNVSDGFFRTGSPNFTANPTFTSGGPCAGNMFRDISGTDGRCRTGNWTLDFVNVASVTPAAPIPEPSALLLAGFGLALLFAMRGRNRSRARLLLGGLVAALASVPAYAQTSCPPVSAGPDYCTISDFLNGKRRLLAIDDVVISGYVSNAAPELPDFYTVTMTAANSQLSSGPVADVGSGSSTIPPNGPPTLTGHIFNRTTATTVVLRSDQPGECALYLPLAQFAPCDRGINSLVPASGVVADFNQDGYDELAVTGVMNGQNVILLARAADVNNTYNQPIFSYGPATQIDPLTDITVGDFNGDGRPEIAGLLSGGLQLVIYTVDPKTLAVSKASQITLQKALTYSLGPTFSITVGNFTSLLHDQIVVASGGFIRNTPNSGNWNTRLELIDFPPSSLVPQESTTTDRGTLSFPTIKVRSGRFNFPGSSYDQVVHAELGMTAVAGIGQGYGASIYTIDPSTLAWKSYPYLSNLNDCAYDMAVGNFDNQQPDPLNPGQTQHNLNDQITVLHGACGSGARTIDIVRADAQTLRTSLASRTSLSSTFNNLVSMSITPSDTQGRSLMLGTPTKITVSQPVQPSVVMGAPPMHVDWISPDPLDNLPAQVMNLSAVPDGFSTTYEVTNTTDKQSGTTNGTSWSLGTKTTAGGFIQFGDPDITGIKVGDVSTAADDLKKSAETENGSYTRTSYNVYQATGFGDQVSYNESDFNIWVYPVLGKTVCPAATPKCLDSQKVPLTIQFSAPSGDAITHQDQGQSLQWYQPPWEPGNVFSYPANFAQLQSIYPNLVKVTSDGAEFLTDTSTDTQKTTWAVGTGTTQTASVEQNFSNENDFSAVGSVSFLDIGAGASVGYDTSGSNGLSNLMKSSSDLGTSTGIAIKKPGTFPSFQLYGYSVSPYILGTTKPGGVVDQQPLGTEVQTFGLIRGLFTADPLASNAGGWWGQAYVQAPDVALNHPSRWQVTFQGLGNPVPPNCLTTGSGSSQMDCAELSYRAPKNPWLSSFHQMRGFFISNANSPGQGPQLEQAKAGDVLTLQARVYNYSLASMPDGSKVHARFYFQPWKGTVPAGDSVLIGEQVLDKIPAFSDVTNAQLNWVLASTTFDTSKYTQTSAGNAYVAFWVVVWIQGPDGKIATEMPGHGLTGIPGNLKSLDDASQLEQIASDNNSYDNNVGFYKQAFYIAPNTNNLGAARVATRGLIDVGKVDVSTRTITPRDTIAISAALSTGGDPIVGVTARFYDGDPRQGGRRFGVERVPYIAANTSYDVATTYRTNACGTHQLFVVVNEGKAGEIVRLAPPVRVDCRTSR